VNISVAYAIFSPADRGNQEVKKLIASLEMSPHHNKLEFFSG